MKKDNDLAKEINRVFYEVEAKEYDSRHPEVLKGDSLWWDSIGRKYITETRSISLLDIGTGTGFVVNILSQYLKGTNKIICYDLSREMLQEARVKLRNVPDVSFLVGDAEQLPFSKESVDIVSMNSVLHHLPNYQLLLKEIDRVLKKKGIFLMAHEPNKLFFKSPLVRIAASLYKLIGGRMKITEYMQSEINRQLKKEGLITVDLSQEEIISLVDYHSPIEQRNITISKNKGFIPQELLKSFFPKYKLLELKEYSTFFHRPFLERSSPLSFFLKMTRKLFLGKGNLFSWVVKK
ncbi:MAG: class I SAM-dependent methyltransferase [bacterium]